MGSSVVLLFYLLKGIGGAYINIILKVDRTFRLYSIKIEYLPKLNMTGAGNLKGR